MCVCVCVRVCLIDIQKELRWQGLSVAHTLPKILMVGTARRQIMFELYVHYSTQVSGWEYLNWRLCGIVA